MKLHSIGVIAVLLGLSTVPSHAACGGSGGLSVLDCLATAYIDRDATAYEALLSPDFTHVGTTPNATWTRAEEVQGANDFFSNNENIQLRIEGIESVEETETGWHLQGIRLSLTWVEGSRPEARTVHLTGEALVEQDADGPRLLRWTDVSRSEEDEY
ncbi:MAG: nuclear transport factor 2 family protein [Candidatus Eisenbacteria bacterium]|uniref:Nuclear transport factor 2 family protein n=1 Tax=Eiseniibacteriota bacterium TaxID=2212470 RepID=A0A956M2C0_UNCEI|nr:nuclear transport factor 2 family protein [Candidatus Eisenbacteria bacterium]